MAGLFGADFDPAKPADSDPVKFGASWIRDLKARAKRFLSPLFNLETGILKDNVVRPESLKDNGVTPGTYNKVTVNSKGLITTGVNDVTQQVASYYRASYYATGSGFVQQADGSVATVTGTPGNYSGGSAQPPFTNTTYAITPTSGTNYYLFTFTPPLGVRRVKATIVGAGGGGGIVSSDSSFYGGGGGELAETVFSFDGTGVQSVNIIVGLGGLGAPSNDTAAFDGVPSRVILSDTVFCDAGPGKGAGVGAGGVCIAGSAGVSLGVIRGAGVPGGHNIIGLSGAAYTLDGRGGYQIGPSQGFNGHVFLEWLA